MKNTLILIALYILLNQSDLPHVEGTWDSNAIAPVRFNDSTFVITTDVLTNPAYPDSVIRYLIQLPTAEIADSEFTYQGNYDI